MTKPKSATSYKETAFGILPRNKVVVLLSIRAETGNDRKRYVEAMKTADKYDYSKLEQLIANALKESLEKA